MRTKMLTSGSLAALQEVLASWIAKDVSKHGHYFSSRVPKMAAYGAFVSAPMGHFLIKILQWLFSGKTSLKAKIFQILISNLFVRLSSFILSQSLLAPSFCSSERLLTFANSDCAHPERCLPDINGHHCRSQNLPPGQCDRSCGVHARHEGHLDHLAAGAGVCPEVPARADLGTFLQLRGVRYRHVHKCTYQEEEVGSVEEESKDLSLGKIGIANPI